MNTATETTTQASEYQTVRTSDAAPLAVPVPAKDYEAVKAAGDAGRVNLLQGGLGPKRGHRCCGGCCDVRRAVIIVYMIMVGFTLCAWIFTYLGFLGPYCLELVPVGMVLFGAMYYNVFLIGIAALLYMLKFLYYCAVLLGILLAFDYEAKLLMPIAMAFLPIRTLC
jgi:hypothetical protein